jgi:tRNA U38,U39,U40 pseudouridine synthase TruA
MSLSHFQKDYDAFESRVRTVYQSEIIQTNEGFDYVVTGSGFLYNMESCVPMKCFAASFILE